MSRTISQLDVGTSVYIREAGVPKEYVLLKKDDDGCILLRAYALKAMRMNPPKNTKYEGSEMDCYLNNPDTGFLSLFDAQTRAAIVTRPRPTYEDGDEKFHYIDRRAFLLTYGELTQDEPDDLEPLTTLVPALMKWRGTSDRYDARVAYCEDGYPVGWWESSPYSAADFYIVSTYGASSYNSASNTYCWARPALNVSAETIVSDEGAETIYLLPSDTSKEGDHAKEITSIPCNFCGKIIPEDISFTISLEAPEIHGVKNRYKFCACPDCEVKAIDCLVTLSNERR